MRYLILFFIPLFFSCTKESIPDPTTDQNPVFHVSGVINEEPFDFRAGDNNMVMETEIYTQKGVPTFAGNLTDGSDYIQLSIKDGDIDLVHGNWMELLPDELDFLSALNEPLTTLSKEYFSNHEIIESIEWIIDGQFAGLNEVPVYEPGKYQVCANVNFVDGWEANLCNELIIGYNKNATSHLRHFLSPNGSFQAWLDHSSYQVEETKWYINGTYHGNDQKLLTSLEKGIYEISAEVTYSNGAKRVLKVVVDGNLNGHFIDDLTVFEDLETEHFADYAALISVKRNGQTYHSFLADNEDAEFHVKGIEPFGTSASGNPIFKLNIELTCLLQHAISGQQIPFEMNGVFGVEVIP
jgi:hypothetical protein